MENRIAATAEAVAADKAASDRFAYTVEGIAALAAKLSAAKSK